MMEQEVERVLEYESPYPLKETQIGDARGLYINSTVAYSYLRETKHIYPVLESSNQQSRLLYYAVCPTDYFGRKYTIYRQNRNGRLCFFIPIPKHLKGAISGGRKKAMYNLRFMLDSEGELLIEISLYGGPK